MQTNNRNLSLFFTQYLKQIKQFFSFFCNIHALLGIFETRHDRVIFISLGEVGFDGLMVANEVAGFGELVVSSGATLSGDLAVVDIILS